jgi:UDP-3-O-[3-hydroxymyristoyl] glucosamine N-acyltransferase
VPDVRLDDLAKTLGRRFAGDGQFKICAVGSLESVGPNDLVYVRDAAHHADLESSPAGAVMLPDVVVAAQSGFGGSSEIGRGTIVMAQLGTAGHLEIGTRAFLGARAGVTKDVPDHARVYGMPQMEDRRWHRSMAALKLLPAMLARVRAIERKLGLRGETGSPSVNSPDDLSQPDRQPDDPLDESDE